MPLPSTRLLLGAAAIAAALLGLAGPLPAQRPDPDPQERPPREEPFHFERIARGITPEQASARLELEKEKIFRHLLPRSQQLPRYLAKYRVIVSENFIIFSNGPRTTHKFKVTLEKLYAFMREHFPFREERYLLKCYVFQTKEEYFDFCEKIAGFPGGRQSAGHANHRYYATFYQSPSSDVVYHEAAHLVVNAVCEVNAGGSWFHEGTAVWVERVFPRQDPNVGQRSAIRYGRYYPLRKLASLPQLLADPNGSRNYAQAGSIMDYMVRGELKEKFRDFLEYLRKHPFTRGERGTAAAIEAVYGMSIDAFEQGWMRHVGFKPKPTRAQQASP